MTPEGDDPRHRPPALFLPEPGGVFVPTQAAEGPWQAGVLHGAPVAALLAGLLDDPDHVVTRVLVEFLGRVRNAPLRAVVGETEGGPRVFRQSAALFDGERAVARAAVLRMRRRAVDLPPEAVAHPVVFDPSRPPDLSRANRAARTKIGRDSFDSLATAVWWDRPEPGSGRRLRVWLRLLVPVVAGRPPSALERAVAAADFSSSGTSLRLDFRSWSFMNADLIVSLGRPVTGEWVGLECDGYLGAGGAGQSVATLHDAAGPFGQASQSILVEPATPG